MKYDKKKALSIIVEAAKQYDEKLKGQHFLILYQDGKEQKYAEIGFRDLNFLHLTGVELSKLEWANLGSRRTGSVSLVETALFDGDLEIPHVDAPNEIIIPKGMVPFSLRERSHDFEDFVCFYEKDVNFRESHILLPIWEKKYLH